MNSDSTEKTVLSSEGESTFSNEATFVEETMPAKDGMVGMILDGRYYIEKELGSGGIGKVYLARDKPELVSRQVVIKVLSEDSLQSEWTVSKFRHEIEALASIDDPGVTGVIDAGTLPDGSPYLVMQYVDGVTLRSVIEPVKDKGVDLESIANIIRQVCCAVASAHDKGIFHRDLKPENIMVRHPNTGKEQVKVIDFGIAKITNPSSAPGTVVEKIVGTPAYMSPEQVCAMPVTAASDVYSVGIIAYEMVTGRKPFNFETPFQLSQLQSAGVKIKPKDLRPALPARAQEVILKALNFYPEDRYAEIRDFGEDLARALGAGPDSCATPTAEEDEGVTIRKPEPAPAKASPNRGLIAALALLLVAGLGFIAWRVFKSNPQTKVAGAGGEVAAAPAAAPAHTISYYMMVQKYRNGAPFKKPYPVPGEMNFEQDDRVQIFFSSPEQGYLYLLNQGPKGADGSLPNLIVLFPEEAQAALLPPNQQVQIPTPSARPDEDWIGFDAAEGAEKLWLVWSAQPVAELEAAKKWSNRNDQGEIKDSGENKVVSEFLSSKFSSLKPEAKKDEEGTRTFVTGKGDMLVYQVTLQHH